MKWNAGHAQRPQGKGNANRRSGYEWDEEGIDDFSYDFVEDGGDYETVEPEYIDVESVGRGFFRSAEEAASVDSGSYARDVDYVADDHYAAGEEYAQDADYVADGHYVAGEEYAQDESYQDADYVSGPEGYADESAEGQFDYDASGINSKQGDGSYYQEEGYEGNGEPYYREEGYEGNGEPYYREEGYEGNGEPYYREEGCEGNGEPYYQEEGYAENGEPYYQEENYAENGGAYYQEEVQGGQTRGMAYSPEDKQSGRNVFKQEETYAQYEDDSDGDEDNEFQGEITYIENYDEKPKPAYVSRNRRRREEEDDDEDEKPGFGLLDTVIAAVGIIVILCLAGVIGMVISQNNKKPQKTENQFANVGQQIQNIELIGGRGILAVSNAEIAKMMPEDEVEEPITTPEPDDGGYDENPYKTTISVVMSLTSVQKDLKIKFSNRETAKLIGNVAFVAQVTKPDGSVEEWTDSDMDGIIYEKGIADGKYSVTLKTLDSEKYPNYITPATAQTVNVKKNIEYAKVDVTGEGKKDSEGNAKQEDTKINETAQEGSLTDTVVWVASTTTGNTYVEVLKSTIPNPETLPIEVAGSFLRTSEIIGEPTPTPDATPTPEPTPTPDATPTPEPTPTPTPEPTPVPYNATIAFNVDKIELKVLKAGDGSTVTESGTVRASVNDLPAGKTVQYDAASANNDIAQVSVDANGVVAVTAFSKGTVNVTVGALICNESGVPETRIIKEFTVVVSEKEALNMALSQGDVLCYSEAKEATAFMTVTILNSSRKASELTEANMKITVETSDATVAQVLKKEVLPSTEDGTVKVKIYVAPQVLQEKKSCIFTVKYEEEKEYTVSQFGVIVKPHPKNDKVTLLKDKEGKQLFVQEGKEYRQAVYADYFADNVKLFIQGAVKYTGWQTIDGKVYYYNAEGLYVTGEQVIQGAKYTFGSDGALKTGSGILGIDVSKWNGSNIDWKAVKNSGVSYVIIRCGFRGSSDGNLWEDSRFASNVKGASNAGLKIGVYFFTQAIDEVEAVYEASFVLDKIKNYKITYPVFLDVEPSGGRGDKISVETRTKVCKAFCQTIQNAGYTAGIYANKTWLNEKINVSDLNSYKIWLAQYAAKPSYEGRYDMWQYKDSGTINGISGKVDLNLSYMGY